MTSTPMPGPAERPSADSQAAAGEFYGAPYGETPASDIPPGSAEQPSIGHLFSSIAEQFSRLVRGEIELAQVNLKAKLTKLGIGGALFGAAAFLALYLVGLLLLAAVWGLGVVMPLWAAFLVVSAVLLIIIGVLIAVGASRIKASQEHTIDPIGGLKADVEAAKKGLKK